MQFEVEIKVRWWFKYFYYPVVHWFALFIEMDIDDDKYNYWLCKATYLGETKEINTEE